MEHAAKKEFLRNTFHDPDSLAAADFQWSLLISAIYSYKHDTVLRPFPSGFIKAESDVHGDINRDMKGLEREAEKIPAFTDILRNNFLCLKNEKHTDLLHWCLNRTNFSLKKCDLNIFADIKELTKHNTTAPSPQFIFEVLPSKEAEEKFQQRSNNKKRFYGYHGSHIENYHSIINYGLQGHMSKNALFGEGTYLSSELSISLQYSPNGRGWDHSTIGDRLSCVAVCEMIDDPSVKCQTKEVPNGLKRTASRSKIAGSEGGEIPETYYIVRNNDCIRVKYLLVYATKSRKKSLSWFHRHKFAVVIMSYVLLLLLISLYSSKAFWSFTRRLTQR